MTPDPIQPALTPEQWTSGRWNEPGRIVFGEEPRAVEFERMRDLFEGHISATLGMRFGGRLAMLEGKECHALAAICLYRHDFGFDGEELNPPAGSIVEALRDTADAIDTACGTKMIGVVHVKGPSADVLLSAHYAGMFRALASRIAALLPALPPSDSEAP